MPNLLFFVIKIFLMFYVGLFWRYKRKTDPPQHVNWPKQSNSAFSTQVSSRSRFSEKYINIPIFSKNLFSFWWNTNQVSILFRSVATCGKATPLPGKTGNTCYKMIVSRVSSPIQLIFISFKFSHYKNKFITFKMIPRS